MTSNHDANKFEADSRKISPFTARVHEVSKHVSATLKILGAKRIWCKFHTDDVRCHRTKFRRPGDLAPVISAPQLHT
jgi:hypothetical protein